MGSVIPHDPASGRRYQVSDRLRDFSQTDKPGVKTKREADLYLASVEAAKSRVAARLSRITVAEWAESWLVSQLQLKPFTR